MLKLENSIRGLSFSRVAFDLTIQAAKVIDKDYSPVLELNNLEHLTLKSCKEVKQLYPQFVKLPKLKYGTVLERPELYEK